LYLILIIYCFAVWPFPHPHDMYLWLDLWQRIKMMMLIATVCNCNLLTLHCNYFHYNTYWSFLQTFLLFERIFQVFTSYLQPWFWALLCFVGTLIIKQDNDLHFIVFNNLNLISRLVVSANASYMVLSGILNVDQYIGYPDRDFVVIFLCWYKWVLWKCFKKQHMIIFFL
jgi:hypothetical protein